MSEEPVIGSAKVGSRGQIVLPVDIRKTCDINEGDTLIVMTKPGHGNSMISLVKASDLSRLMESMEGTYSRLRSIIDEDPVPEEK